MRQLSLLSMISIDLKNCIQVSYMKFEFDFFWVSWVSLLNVLSFLDIMLNNCVTFEYTLKDNMMQSAWMKIKLDILNLHDI